MSQLKKAEVTDPIIAGNASNQVSRLTKVTFRIDQDVAGRLRAAYLAHGQPAGYLTLASWVNHLLSESLTEVEASDGPLPPIPAGVLPTGPRITCHRKDHS